MVDREDKLCVAQLAEQAGRYEEMRDAMKSIAELGTGLSPAEQNLFSVAYKNVTGALRASWRILSRLENEKKERNEEDSALTKNYRERIETELRNICHEVLTVLDRDLIPSVNKLVDEENDENVTENAAYVFYYKMKGDYLRYISEISTGEERGNASENAFTAYNAAYNVALQPTHPIRLGMALNFSVFLYEIVDAPERACSMAKQAFDKAVAKVDKLSEQCYKDTTLIMQLLRDNLTLWTCDMELHEFGIVDDEEKI